MNKINQPTFNYLQDLPNELIQKITTYIPITCSEISKEFQEYTNAGMRELWNTISNDKSLPLGLRNRCKLIQQSSNETDPHRKRGLSLFREFFSFYKTSNKKLDFSDMRHSMLNAYRNKNLYLMWSRIK